MCVTNNTIRVYVHVKDKYKNTIVSNIAKILATKTRKIKLI